MSRTHEPAEPVEPILDADAGARGRWEAALLERFDEPIAQATRLTRRTLAWFPIRVWRHFLQHNGFLLAAGISYQALFAIFAVIYVGFAAVGLWLGGSQQAIEGLIGIVNSYIPDLISEEGLVTPEAVAEIAADSGSVLLTTGGIALIVAVWTAIGFVTYLRRAVRDTFGLPFDRRSYILLKARDFFAALIFGVALVVGAALANAATWALGVILDWVGIEGGTVWTQIGVRVVTLLVAFVINAAAIGALFKFLVGATLRWRRVWVGSLLGGAAVVVLQIGAGILLGYSPSNPLLATFAIFIGFMLWFRLNGIVILVAAAWVAVDSADRELSLVEETEAERRIREHAALELAAQIRVREARIELESASWWHRGGSRRRLALAEQELGRLESERPPPLKVRFLD